MTTTPDHSRTERFLPWNVACLAFRLNVTPNWLEGDRFWYRVATREGDEVALVDPVAGTRTVGYEPPADPPPVTSEDGYMLPSPDSRWAAFTRDDNLWVRDAASGVERALTTDDYGVDRPRPCRHLRPLGRRLRLAAGDADLPGVLQGLRLPCRALRPPAGI